MMPAAATGVVQADQAIFTSIRSPLIPGSGYRIVVASCGITPEERREILPAAPSHGALCHEEPGARGLASFPLSSGRWCLFFSHNAGAEYSGRGGARVHTHVLVLDAAGWQKLFCDPLRVRAAAEPKLNPNWTRQPPTSLGKLALERPAVDSHVGVLDDYAALRALLASVLSQRPIALVDVPQPNRVLRALLDGLPVAVRQRLALSSELKLSPSRPVRLLLASRETAAERVAEHGLSLLRWALPGVTSAAATRWVDLVERHCHDSRLADLRALTDALTVESTPDELSAIAGLVAALDDVPRAEADEVNSLERLAKLSTPRSPGHAQLCLSLEKELARRRAELDQGAPDPD